MSLRWQKKTRQEVGRITEHRLLKAVNARIHPMSGAGSIKYDGSTDSIEYEIKDANEKFTLDGAQLRASFSHAASQGKQSVWVVHFTDANIDAIIALSPSKET